MQSYPLHSGYPVENLDGLWEFAFRENMICREERCPEIRFDDVIPVHPVSICSCRTVRFAEPGFTGNR